MSDETANIIIEHLRALRAGQDDIQAQLQEVKMRLTSIEHGLHRSRADTAQAQEDVYRQQTVIDQLQDRIKRIEKRLDLS